MTLLAAAQAGCFSPQLADGEIACGEAGCPDGMACAEDGLCYSVPASADSGRRSALAVAYRGEQDRVYAWCQGRLELVWTDADWRQSRAVAWHDIDGDDVPELAIGAEDEGVMLYRIGDGGLDKVSTENLWSAPRDLAWGDFGGDGVPSLAVAIDHEQLRVIEYGRDGQVALSWISDEAHAASGLAVADFDRNGHDDILVGAREERSVMYQGFSDGLRLTWRAELYDDTEGVAAGDYDGDGDADFAIANDWQPLRVYRNDSDGFELAWSSSESPGGESLAFADVDGDSQLDLAVGTDFDRRTELFRNQDRGGPNLFEHAWSSDEQDDTQSIAWGDPDGDGDPDLAVASDGQPVRLYRTIDGELALAWSSDEVGPAWDVSWTTWQDGPDPCGWP